MLKQEHLTTLERKIERFSHILSKNPGDGLTVLALAEASFRRGLKLEALTAYQAVTKEQPVPEAHLSVAEIYLQQDMTTEAYGELRQLFQLDPENVEARMLARELESKAAPPADIKDILMQPTSEAAFDEARLRLQLQRGIHNRELQERTRNGTLEPGVVIHEYYIEEAKKKLIEVDEQLRKLEELRLYNATLAQLPRPDAVSAVDEAVVEEDGPPLVEAEDGIPEMISSEEPAAVPGMEVPGQEPVAATPVEMPGQEPVAAAPVEISSQEPVAAVPVEIPSQEPVAAVPVEMPSQEPVAAAPVEMPSQEPVAAAPVEMPSLEPVAAVPVEIPSQEPVDAEPLRAPEPEAIAATSEVMAEPETVEFEAPPAEQLDIPAPPTMEPDLPSPEEVLDVHLPESPIDEFSSDEFPSVPEPAVPEDDLGVQDLPPLPLSEHPAPDVESPDPLAIDVGVEPIVPDLPEQLEALPEAEPQQAIIEIQMDQEPPMPSMTVPPPISTGESLTAPPAIEPLPTGGEAPVPTLAAEPESAVVAPDPEPALVAPEPELVVEPEPPAPVAPAVTAAERQAFYESKAEELGKLTGTLARTRGVTSIFLVNRDGTTIDSVVKDNITEGRVGELVRESFDFLLAYADSPSYWVLECNGGIFVMQTLDEDHVLIAVGQAGANFGALRYTMDKTKAKFGDILGEVPR